MIKHLACIMDGNRRWARRKGLLPWLGHREGVNAIQRAIDFCLDKKIAYLSLYTFSLENFKRPQEELNFLFSTMAQESEGLLAQCLKKEIRIKFVGDRTQFPSSIIPVCKKLEESTAHFSKLQVNFLFCYGGRQEIVGGVKKIIHDIKAGILQEDQLTDELFAQKLWTAGIPDPELIVRTGGVRRLSNFLLYQAAYTELYFLDCLWPELTPTHLDDALTFFENCQRNYGK